MKLLNLSLLLFALTTPLAGQGVEAPGGGKIARRARGALDAPRDLAREFLFGSYKIEALADIDGNGRIDLLAFRSGNVDILPILNTGLDEYTLGTPFGKTESRYVRYTADLTGNGFPDLVTDVLGATPGFYVHLNQGGTFEPPLKVETGDLRPELGAQGEIDFDGGPEFVAVHRELPGTDYYARWWEWNGTTLVSSPTTLVTPDPYSIVSADFSGDGRDDVLLTTHEGGQAFLLQTGADRSLSVVQTIDAFPAASGYEPLIVATGDIDQDGDVDAVLHWYELGVDSLLVLRNDGALPLVLEPLQTYAHPDGLFFFNMQLVDWDEDGDLDLLGDGGELVQLENVGGLTFERRAEIPFDRNGTILHLRPPTDLNGDGFVDYVGDSLIKSGNGTFEDTAEDVASFVDFARAIDVDGDSDLDLVEDSGTLYFNDGSGHFTTESIVDLILPTPPPLFSLSAGSAGDFDGDGEIDVIVFVGGPLNGQERLVRSEGDGTYTQRAAAPLNVKITSLLFLPPVDIDGDGDLDLVNRSGWAENDGSGYFATVHPSWDDTPLAAADVDGDGDVDVAVDYDYTALLFRNDGFGSFTSSQLSDQSFRRAHWVDLDEDGYPEFVTRALSNTVRIYANVGGAFPGPPLTLTGPSFTSEILAFDDFDGDGKLDVLGSRERNIAINGESTLIWRQSDGPALAFDEPQYFFTDVGPVTSGDFDGDGDLDLMRFKLLRGWRNNAGRSGKIRQVPDPVQPQGARALLGARGALAAGETLELTVTRAPGPGWITLAAEPGSGPTPRLRERTAFRRSLRVGPGRSVLPLRLPEGLNGTALHVNGTFLDPTAEGGLSYSNALVFEFAP